MNEALEVIKGPDVTLDIVKWNGLSIQAERMANAIEIATDEEDQMAIDTLSQVKTFQKQVDAAQMEALDPFKVLVNRIRNAFAPITTSLANAEAIIKGKRKAFLFEKDRIKAQEEAKRLKEYQDKIAKEREEAKAKGEPPKIVTPPPAVMAPPPTTRGDVGKSTATDFWNYEVTDIKALYAARPELVKMEVKRRETLEALKTNQSIPGLKVFKDKKIGAS